MKKLVIVLLSVLLVNICMAQKKESYIGKFMRVFNDRNKKIYTGKLAGLTDSTFIISKIRTKTEVSIKDVKLIKFSRSAGHSILAVSGACAVGLAVYAPLRGPALDALFSPVVVALAGFVTGAAVGVPIGALVGAAKPKRVFTINNDINEWIKVKEQLK